MDRKKVIVLAWRFGFNYLDTRARLHSKTGATAALDNSGNVFAELSLDVAQPLRAATILHHAIVQQRGDRFRFVRAIFHRDRSRLFAYVTDREKLSPARFPIKTAMTPK